jgi:hypothetical protein
MAQITTLTFFRFGSIQKRAWGFAMMQFAHKHLKRITGCTFYKLMGSGKGSGFSPFPDWSVYSLLQVWENEEYADTFFNTSDLMTRYDHHSQQRYTIYLKNISAKGLWSGKEPFTPSTELDPENPLLAVITRATIKSSQLHRFWQYVPTSEKPLSAAKGLIYTKGIGEVPVIQMATFSIWESAEELNKFAYHSKEHAGAIQRTRSFNWYREEMFSRFQPYRAEGEWEGTSNKLLKILNG